MLIATAYYQVGTPDNRFKQIEKATPGAIKLYQMIKKENKGPEAQEIARNEG